MMRLQIASIPRFPRTSRNSWPIGNGKSVLSNDDTEDVAKDAAMRTSHPRIAVLATPRRIAIGALRCAPATSSEI